MRRLALSLVVVLLALPAWAQEEKITLEQVPEVVRETILRETGGHEIKEIEVETQDGQSTYEVEWEQDGKEIEIKIDANGQVIEREES